MLIIGTLRCTEYQTILLSTIFSVQFNSVELCLFIQRITSYCASNDTMYELCIYLCSHVHQMVIFTTFVKCILQQINVLTNLPTMKPICFIVYVLFDEYCNMISKGTMYVIRSFLSCWLTIKSEITKYIFDINLVKILF